MALFTTAEELGGQRQAVTPGYKVKEKNWLQKGALAAMGLPPSDAKRIGTQKSEEAPDVGKTSPVIGFKGY